MIRTYELKRVKRGWNTRAEKVYVDSISGIRFYRFKDAWGIEKWNMTDKFDDNSTVWYPNPTKAIKAYLQRGREAIRVRFPLTHRWKRGIL